MSYLLDVGIGIASGVLTSLVLFIFYTVKVRQFEPWLENRLYKGVLLSGKWSGCVNSNTAVDSSGKPLPSFKFDFELSQNGYSVSGFFNAETIHYGQSNEVTRRYSNFYKIKGTIRNNFAVIEYTPVSRRRTGLGVFIFEVKNGGQSLVGDCIYLVESNTEIEMLESVKVTRQGE